MPDPESADRSPRQIRLAATSDLSALEALYRDLNPQRPELLPELANRIIRDIVARPDLQLLVVEVGTEIVASAMLVLAPNLMRGGRPYALIENVVTCARHRRQGHGKAVIAAALAAAWKEGAYQVYLLTGRPDPSVHRFYESCGFRSGVKIGYVAQAPVEVG